MILIPLLVAAAVGFFVHPARRAQVAVGLTAVVLGVALWFAAAHDDGETDAFVASIAGLWAVCAVLAFGGSYAATRRR